MAVSLFLCFVGNSDRSRLYRILRMRSNGALVSNLGLHLGNDGVVLRLGGGEQRQQQRHCGSRCYGRPNDEAAHLALTLLTIEGCEELVIEIVRQRRHSCEMAAQGLPDVGIAEFFLHDES